MPKVSLLKCNDYENTALKESVIKGLEHIHFDFNILKNAYVALKPNLLMPAKPESTVITHPEFFRAVAEIVKEYTDKIYLIESPNGVALLQKVMKKAEYQPIIKELSINVPDATIPLKIQCDKVEKYKHIEISKAYFDMDVIINLPKLKTHGLTHYSGAVKNLFGTIPGMRKSRMHLKAPTVQEFSEFLLDLYGCLLFGFEKPIPFLHIMDAVMGMEGEGPGATGKPRKIGAILASEDAVALDYAAINLVGLDLKRVLTVTKGFERKYGAKSPGDVEILGEHLEEMKITNFSPSKIRMFGGVFWPMTTHTFKNLLTEKPVPSEKTCTLCLDCMKICPAQAIKQNKDKKKIPLYDYNTCIRCFCCMEICPEGAIKAQKGKLQWIMGAR